MKKLLLLFALSVGFINSNARCFFYHKVMGEIIIDGWSDLPCADLKLDTAFICVDLTIVDNPTRENWVVNDNYAGPIVYNYNNTLYTFNFDHNTGDVTYLSYSGVNCTQDFFLRIKYQNKVFFFVNHATFKAMAGYTTNMNEFQPEFTIQGSPNPVGVNCNVVITSSLQNPTSPPLVNFTVTNSSGLIMLNQTFGSYTFGFNTASYPNGYYTIQAIINNQYYTSSLIVKN